MKIAASFRHEQKTAPPSSGVRLDAHAELCGGPQESDGMLSERSAPRLGVACDAGGGAGTWIGRSAIPPLLSDLLELPTAHPAGPLLRGKDD